MSIFTPEAIMHAPKLMSKVGILAELGNPSILVNIVGCREILLLGGCLRRPAVKAGFQAHWDLVWSRT
jgi:hypothetical protein